MKKINFKKVLSFILLILIFSIFVIQIASPKQTNRNTITVDDEPGDADYTSIKEAINNANIHDTIEVYSGTYIEDEISVFIPNLTINGIPNELGEGNDTGKPIIKALGSKDCILIHENNVTFTGFQIETKSNHGIIVYSDDCAISENFIQTVDGVCVFINGTHFGGKRNDIIQNAFSNHNSTFAYGITLDYAMSNTIVKNDFLINTNACFSNSFRNTWIFNFWQYPRILPKIIFGTWSISTEIFSGTISWFNIDWRPALAPNTDF